MSERANADRIPRITRCKLCAHYRRGRGCWFCALHNHIATDRDGCTWGEEADDGGE